MTEKEEIYINNASFLGIMGGKHKVCLIVLLFIISLPSFSVITNIYIKKGIQTK
jgi:hypothetical protein